MCGIVGYVGPNQAMDFLVEGLRRLEYRGYDSAGVVTINGRGGLSVVKTAGRVEDLATKLSTSPVQGHLGLGHTRWATHGPATDENAHPHLGGDGVLALVHNGVIENFHALKNRLTEEGCVFETGTDTEVIAHLIARELETQDTSASQDEADPYAPLVAAVQSALA